MPLVDSQVKVTLATAGDEYWLADFCFTHYHVVSNWKDYELLDFIRWYIDLGFCFYIRNGSLQSLLLVRPCFDPFTLQAYAKVYTPLGHTLFVDLLVSVHGIRNDWKSYILAISQFFSGKKYIAFSRDFRDNQYLHEIAKLKL